MNDKHAVHGQLGKHFYCQTTLAVGIEAELNIACTSQNVFWAYYSIHLLKFVSTCNTQLCTFIKQHCQETLDN